MSEASGYEDAKTWTTIVGTDPSNKITIDIGVTEFFDIIIEVPEFTPENAEAEVGLYGVKIKVKSYFMH